MSNWGILSALVFEPRKAFAELAERPKFWFPLLLLVVATGVIAFWYTNVVDLGWAADQQIRHSFLARNLTEDQIAQQVQMASSQRGLRSVLSVVAVGFALPIGMLIAALYNFLVGKITGMQRGYGQWFSYCCWVALPGALGAIPAALALATTETTQFTQEALKTLSLNSLLFHRAIGEPGFSFLSAIDLFTLASLYLSLVGVKVWSGRSWLFAALFVGIPWVLVYGIWGWFSFR